jgi:hypothetical protein
MLIIKAIEYYRNAVPFYGDFYENRSLIQRLFNRYLAIHTDSPRRHDSLTQRFLIYGQRPKNGSP